MNPYNSSASASTVGSTMGSWASQTETSNQDDRIAQLESEIQDLTDRLRNVSSIVQNEYENYTLALLDGNKYVFLERLLMEGNSGAMGGATAARLLTIAIRRLYPGLERISIFLYLDFERLTRKHRDSGIMLHESRFNQFVRSFAGYSKSHSLYAMIDIGSGLNKVMRHLDNQLEMQLSSLGCCRILLGCRRNDLPKILGPRLRDRTLIDRITLVESVEALAVDEFAGFGVARFDSVFRNILLAGDR